jgi:hypothetical protein
MARVEWTRQSGDDVETLLGIMLCREFPNATRLKPSQGDGGIDVFVAGPDGMTVYQIKAYTGPLTSAQKRHIRESWNTLLEYSEANSLTIARWYLVTLENPTKEQVEWLNELTGSVEFPCVWKGRDFADGLAAKYPDVVDYYLQDGKERLEKVVSRFLGLARHENVVESPASTTESLEELHAALNQFDPHFYYDFSVAAALPDGSCPPIEDDKTPRLVSVVQFGNGKQCVTYRIIARYNGATSDRPIPGAMTLEAETGTELQQRIEAWIKFGTPLDNVPAKMIELDLPGGFAVPPGDALVTIGPTEPDGIPVEMTLRILDSVNSTLAELDFITDEVTHGVEGQSVRAVGHDARTNVVRYELRIHFIENTFTIDLHSDSLKGRVPSDLVPVIEFLNNMRPSRKLQFAVRDGPELGRPTEITEAMITEEAGRLHRDVCDYLVVIQKQVLERIVFPDLSTTTWDRIEEWAQAAAILDGEEITGTWDELHIHLAAGVDPPSGVQRASFLRPLAVRIEETSYELGMVVTDLATMHVDTTRPPKLHEDHSDIWIVPGPDNAVTMRSLQASDPPTGQ